MSGENAKVYVVRLPQDQACCTCPGGAQHLGPCLLTHALRRCFCVKATLQLSADCWSAGRTAPHASRAAVRGPAGRRTGERRRRAHGRPCRGGLSPDAHTTLKEPLLPGEYTALRGVPSACLLCNCQQLSSVSLNSSSFTLLPDNQPDIAVLAYFVLRTQQVQQACYAAES